MNVVKNYSSGFSAGFWFASALILSIVFVGIYLLEKFPHRSTDLELSTMVVTADKEILFAVVPIIMAVDALDNKCKEVTGRECIHVMYFHEYDKALITLVQGRDTIISFKPHVETLLFRVSLPPRHPTESV